MSKAILVIDMPESCDKCPLCVEGYGGYGAMTGNGDYCAVTGCWIKNSKEEWCPLRPMPATTDFYKTGSKKDKVRMLITNEDKDLYVVDYDKKEGLYRVSFFDENNHYINEVCFKEYEE